MTEQQMTEQMLWSCESCGARKPPHTMSVHAISGAAFCRSCQRAAAIEAGYPQYAPPLDEDE